METQKNAMNVVLRQVAAADGPALARILLLSLVHSETLLDVLAQCTLVRWAECAFSGKVLQETINELYGGNLCPLIVMDSVLHPVRLVLFGARAPIVEFCVFRTDATQALISNVPFFGALSMLVRRHVSYVGNFYRLGHAWDVSNVFRAENQSDASMLRACSHALAYALRKKMCALMNFDPDRWDLVWFSMHDSTYIPRDMLKDAYEAALAPPKIAAPVVKKKKIHKISVQKTINEQK